MKHKKVVAVLCLTAATAVSGSALAAVAPEEAARLGQETDLTPMGAGWQGNADGSIPAWNPDGAPVPAAFEAGSDHYVDPYADEKPLYVIDGNNWQEHADLLTEGTKAIFERYGADGFRMDVYTSHRDSVAPDWLYANNKRNATGASLVADGQKVDGHYPGVPFPIPQTGMEVLWNHLSRYTSDHTINYDTYYVSSKGRLILSTTGYMTNVLPMYRNPDQQAGDAAWLKLRINYLAPARRAGEILLVHEPGADFTEGKGRRAWQYLTGQRRVRLAPAVAFDTPNPATAGTSTYDDAFIYNGSPERYDWKLIGKKEMIIPYNCYDFVFQQDTLNVMGDKFINPDTVRWEKHRVWIVEGILKEGMRHQYSKRRFYIDEDMWAGVASDSYDGQGSLWRVQFAYPTNLYDIQSNYHFAYGTYDVLQSIYNINGKPLPGGFKKGVEEGDRWFTPKAMARSGVR